MDIELGLKQIETAPGVFVDVPQQRKKTKWVDGSTTRNGRYDWSEWEDVPVIQENE